MTTFGSDVALIEHLGTNATNYFMYQ